MEFATKLTVKAVLTEVSTGCIVNNVSKLPAYCRMAKKCFVTGGRKGGKELPIDGGLSLFVGARIAYGTKRAYNSRNKKG